MEVTGVLIQGDGSDGVENSNWVQEFVILVTNDIVRGQWDKIGLYTTTTTEYGTALPEVRHFKLLLSEEMSL